MIRALIAALPAVPGVKEATELRDNQTVIIWILIMCVLGLLALGTYIIRHHGEGMRAWREDRAASTADRRQYSDKLENLILSNQRLLEKIASERAETDRLQIEARVRNTEALNLNNEVLTALISKLATGMMMTPENRATVAREQG